MIVLAQLYHIRIVHSHFMKQSDYSIPDAEIQQAVSMPKEQVGNNGSSIYVPGLSHCLQVAMVGRKLGVGKKIGDVRAHYADVYQASLNACSDEDNPECIAAAHRCALNSVLQLDFVQK